MRASDTALGLLARRDCYTSAGLRVIQSLTESLPGNEKTMRPIQFHELAEERPEQKELQRTAPSLTHAAHWYRIGFSSSV
jgi:hypothetical protein